MIITLIAFNLLDCVIDPIKLVCVLKYIEGVTNECPSLMLCTPTELFMYYMMAFLCAPSIIMQRDVHDLIHEQISKFLNKWNNFAFNFDISISELKFTNGIEGSLPILLIDFIYLSMIHLNDFR